MPILDNTSLKEADYSDLQNINERLLKSGEIAGIMVGSNDLEKESCAIFTKDRDTALEWLQMNLVCGSKLRGSLREVKVVDNTGGTIISVIDTEYSFNPWKYEYYL